MGAGGEEDKQTVLTLISARKEKVQIIILYLILHL